MPDLDAAIRSRLDGWLPAPRRVEYPFWCAPPLTTEQKDELVAAFEAEWKDVVEHRVVALPRPRHYPGFDEMRDAVVAVLDMHAPVYGAYPECLDGAPGYEAERVEAPCRTVLAIAEKLGIDT